MVDPQKSLFQCYGGPNNGMACTMNSDCPQGPGGAPTTCQTLRAFATGAAGDMDVDGDGRLDYFMGQWKFVDPATMRNVVVRKWCINGGTPTVTNARCVGGLNVDKACKKNADCTGSICQGFGIVFHDMFSLEVRTSVNGVENTADDKRIKPGPGTPT